MQADFLSVINGDHMSRMDSCSGLEVLSAASCSEHDGNDKLINKKGFGAGHHLAGQRQLEEGHQMEGSLCALYITNLITLCLS